MPPVVREEYAAVMTFRLRAALALCAGLSVMIAGCTSSSQPATGLTVVATFYPLQYFAQRIGGARVEVRTLVPPGAEPHDYEPTPQDVVALRHARVVVFNGAGLEPWLMRLLPEVPASAVRVNATEGLPLITGEPGNTGAPTLAPLARGGAGERHALVDPHVWLDPMLARDQVARILAGFVRADSRGRSEYQANAAVLDLELRALHGRFEEALAYCGRREFIVTHAAYGYLARRYGLTQVAITGLTPEAEPPPARLAEVVGVARQRSIPVVYYEPLDGPRLAEAVAREAGARVAPLNPLEGLTLAQEREGDNYFTVMHANLSELIAGLDCR